MRVSNSCYAVTGLGAVPPWAVNAGIIVGSSKTLIIDTGANVLAAQTIHGYASAIRPNNELIVFNCEPHFDHIGGNSFFQNLGIDIFGHPDIQRSVSQFEGEKDEYNDSVTNQVRTEAHEADAFYVQTKVVNPNKSAVAGDRFDLGEIDVQVFATPGHTAINQSVYNPTDNVLFCADCIVTDYIPNLEAGGPSDWTQWLKSLDMLEALAPAVVVPGHGRVMRSDQITFQINRVRETVTQALERGKAPTV